MKDVFRIYGVFISHFILIEFLEINVDIVSIQYQNKRQNKHKQRFYASCFGKLNWMVSIKKSSNIQRQIN